ncbi:MAG TPA: class I SAM-dependent methyltransferase [Candidatus Babeliales bacterium]|nr:class I SAM-dependent methyltransferase [Candidatus Babeliales bacterium]
MKPDYGVDAPHVIRNIFLCAIAGMIVGPVWLAVHPSGWFYVAVASYICFTGFISLLIGCWMLYGIKVAKPRLLLKMLRKLDLKGQETVLDIGCGRGLLLCKAAQRLPHGQAVGIDLWSTVDQSGNAATKTQQNAHAEGVSARVKVATGDARQLPFAEHSFDVVVSSLCLHNIKSRAEREQALQEIVRVLKPGGKFALADIQYGQEYAAYFASQGLYVACSAPIYRYCPPLTIVTGHKLN